MAISKALLIASFFVFAIAIHSVQATETTHMVITSSITQKQHTFHSPLFLYVYLLAILLLTILHFHILYHNAD